MDGAPQAYSSHPMNAFKSVVTSSDFSTKLHKSDKDCNASLPR